MEYTNIFESALPQPGKRTTETTHRKVELQSPADFTYVVANVSRAAREKIDRVLPADAATTTLPPEKRRRATRNSGGGEDEDGAVKAAAASRPRVEELVDDVCCRVPFPDFGGRGIENGCVGFVKNEEHVLLMICWAHLQYIRATFNAAKDNLCINGMDSAELDAELAKAQEGEGECFGAEFQWKG